MRGLSNSKKKGSWRISENETTPFCALLSGYPVPYVFLTDEARTLGFSPESSANLLVYLSSVNTVGRVVAGKNVYVLFTKLEIRESSQSTFLQFLKLYFFTCLQLRRTLPTFRIMRKIPEV